MFCALLLIKKCFFPPPPPPHSRSTSWSKTRYQAPSVCSALWKWMIQSVSLPSFENIDLTTSFFVAFASGCWKGCTASLGEMVSKIQIQNVCKGHIAFIPLASSLFCTVRLGVEWSRVSGWNVGCTSIVCRGALSPVKSSFEHIWSCFCETRRAAPISWWEADAHRMATGV